MGLCAVNRFMAFGESDCFITNISIILIDLQHVGLMCIILELSVERPGRPSQ